MPVEILLSPQRLAIPLIAILSLFCCSPANAKRFEEVEGGPSIVIRNRLERNGKNGQIGGVYLLSGGRTFVNEMFGEFSERCVFCDGGNDNIPFGSTYKISVGPGRWRVRIFFTYGKPGFFNESTGLNAEVNISNKDVLLDLFESEKGFVAETVEYFATFGQPGIGAISEVEDVATKSRSGGSSVSRESSPDSEGPETIETPEMALRKIKRLYDDGILTKEEFEQKKKELIGQIGSSIPNFRQNQENLPISPQIPQLSDKEIFSRLKNIYSPCGLSFPREEELSALRHAQDIDRVAQRLELIQSKYEEDKMSKKKCLEARRAALGL